MLSSRSAISYTLNIQANDLLVTTVVIEYGFYLNRINMEHSELEEEEEGGGGEKKRRK